MGLLAGNLETDGETIHIPETCDPEDIDPAVCCVYGISPKSENIRVSVLDVLDALDAPDAAYATLDAALFDQGRFIATDFVEYVEEVQDKLPKTWQIVKHLRLCTSGALPVPRYAALVDPLPDRYTNKNPDRMTRPELLEALGLDTTPDTKKELAARLTAHREKEEAEVEAIAQPLRKDIAAIYKAAKETSKANKLGDWTLGVAGDITGLGHDVHAGILPRRLWNAWSVCSLTRSQAEGFRAALYDLLYDAPPRLSSLL